jgi:ATP-binding cassette subfamily F protein uup
MPLAGIPAASEVSKPAPTKQASSNADNKSAPRKLSYNEKRELESLPKQIETLEAEQHELNKKMEAPEFYLQDGGIIIQAVDRLQQIHDELSRLYHRWGELES